MANVKYFQESELVFKEKSNNPIFQDLEGKTFGRLHVIGFAGRINRITFWFCKCNCGNIIRLFAGSLKNKNTRSCGCIRKEVHTIHGCASDGVRTKEYNAWQKIIARCYNPNTLNFYNYGGRGIQVCERWRESFENFLADMGQAPKGFSIDRYPDNDGNYCPENCRWASQKEQMNNTRRNIILTHNGITSTATKWAERLSINPHTLLNRIYRGWTPERALTTPISSKKDANH